LHSAPYEALLHILVIMAIDVPGRSHFRPWDIRVPGFQFIWKTPRRFRNDFEGDGVENQLVVTKRFILKPLNELAGQIDVVTNVQKAILRT
jgi:hypothetical protein